MQWHHDYTNENKNLNVIVDEDKKPKQKLTISQLESDKLYHDDKGDIYLAYQGSLVDYCAICLTDRSKTILVDFNNYPSIETEFTLLPASVTITLSNK